MALETIMLLESACVTAGGVEDPVTVQDDDMRAANPAVLRWIGEDIGGFVRREVADGKEIVNRQEFGKVEFHLPDVAGTVCKFHVPFR